MSGAGAGAATIAVAVVPSSSWALQLDSLSGPLSNCATASRFPADKVQLLEKLIIRNYTDVYTYI